MRFLVTAGPTREYIDPVRFLSNPSTGRMGFAVAAAARKCGHEVTLIAGPVALRTPKGVERVDIVSARDLLEAVEKRISSFDVLVMTAAVADWRPEECANEKLKKSQMSGVLKLVRNPDILKALKKYDLIKIGFAAETSEPTREAARKCREKGLACVVGNNVSEKGCGFATKTNRVTFVFSDGTVQPLPMLTKGAVALRIIYMAEKIAAKSENFKAAIRAKQ